MNIVTSLILRRMRTPLIVLILAYTVCMIGIMMIPGVDDNGNTWRMGFFHAFYFVSYTATTIGFGEIPYPLSDAQRLWTLAMIYISVIAWLYSIGTIISLVQDPALKKAIKRNKFRKSINQINSHFYIICGFGDTGEALVNTLTRHDLRAVVMDTNQNCIDKLILKDYQFYIPALCHDASEPKNLIHAGLHHEYCAGVIALTHNDNTNLKISISCKLLNPNVPIICRAENQEIETNLASFGTEYIIDPFIMFADRFSMALHSPSLYLLYDWLTAQSNSPLTEPQYPPVGHWIVCGFGRFGKAIYKVLILYHMKVTVIEPSAGHVRELNSSKVIGYGTDAHSLISANITTAVGIIAGTDNDTNNLSIIMTAKDLNPKLFLIARQNERANRRLFTALNPNMIMQSGNIIAHEIRSLLITPLLSNFLNLAKKNNITWSNHLLTRVCAVSSESVPYTWTLSLTEKDAWAFYQAKKDGRSILVKHILKDPQDASRNLKCLVLLLLRNNHYFLEPDEDIPLYIGDQLLLCGDYSASINIQMILNNMNALNYNQSIENAPTNLFIRWVFKKI